MSSPFLAEIRIFPFNFAPRQWAFCNGQILPISQNTALFALVGVTYGGNGTTNFQLPNLQGLFPIAQGQGGGLSPYRLGQTGGTTTVTLTTQQIAAHVHSETANTGSPTDTAPANDYLLQAGQRGAPAFFGPDSSTAPMANAAVSQTGSNQPHNNMPLFLTLNYCICLSGVFPQRS